MFTSKNGLLIFLLIILSLAGCSEQSAGSHKKQIKRVISLSPHITEILYALGQQDKLVAVSDFCAYPPEVQQKERIGGLLNPNLEKILLLHPDALLGTPAHASLKAKFKTQQIPVILLPNDQLKDVFFTIDSIGSLLNCQAQAKKLVQSIKDSLNYYRRLAQQEVRFSPKAALIIGRDVGSVRHLTVAGPHTFLDSLWTLMGGQNIFADLGVRYSQVGQESFLIRKPEVIIEFKFKESWSAQRDSLNRLEWQPLAEIPAVKQGHIFVLTGDYTLIPGPRIYRLARDYLEILKKVSEE